MSQLDDALKTFTAQWYNAVTTGLNLDPKQFQIAQGFQSQNPDSDTALWNSMDAVPPNSINNFYDPNQFNNFSQNYGAIINSLVPTTPNTFNQCVGDKFDSWIAFLTKQNPFPSTGDLPSVFNRWAAIYAPDKVGCATDYAQVLNDPLNLNLQNYVAASKQGKGPFAYNVSVAQVNKLFRDQKTTFSLNSKTSSSSTSHSWSNTSASGIFGLFSYSRSRSSSSQSAFNAGMDVTVTFDRLLTQPVGPLAKADPENSSLKNYVPWYNSAVMNRAYKNQGSDVWKDGSFTNWKDNFSNTGSMQRVASALILVDGIKIEIKSATAYSKAEQSEIQTTIKGGAWPFFRADNDTGRKTTATFSDSGAMTMTSVCPKGQPAILGILQTPISSYLG